MGGLVGRNSGAVSKSFVTGVITGYSFDYGHAYYPDKKYSGYGGLVGRNEGSIISSYAVVEVSGSHAVGGLVGSHDGVISVSYAKGNVSANFIKVGGLVGELGSGVITASYATGRVSVGEIHSGMPFYYYIQGNQAILAMPDERDRKNYIHSDQPIYDSLAKSLCRSN